MDTLDKSISLPGYGMGITASTNHDCFPNALFEHDYGYVHFNCQTHCAIVPLVLIATHARHALLIISKIEHSKLHDFDRLKSF